MKDTQDYFTIGTMVNVTAYHDDVFAEDFTGVVVGHKDGRYVQVRDQDDDVWDCDPQQLKFNTDDIIHGNG